MSRLGQPAVQSEFGLCVFSDFLLTMIRLTRGYSAQTENGIVWYSANRCTSYNSDDSHLWTFTKAGTTSSMRTADGINAKAIFIRWQPSDVATRTATSTGVSSTVLPTATSQGKTQTDGQPSKAWVAGPVIGAVVAFVLIALAAIWYIQRRKYQLKSNEDGFQPRPRHYRRELPADGTQVFEAPSDTVFSSNHGVKELPATNTVSELP